MTKKQSEGVGYLILIVIVIGLIAKFFESVGVVVPAILLVAGIALYIYVKKQNEKKRYEYLMNKYNNEEIVEDIIKETIWQGETEEQLVDSLGRPEAIDNKILKTKKKEVYKYHHQSANRYRLRITLENDIVVGWDKKS